MNINPKTVKHQLEIIKSQSLIDSKDKAVSSDKKTKILNFFIALILFMIVPVLPLHAITQSNQEPETQTMEESTPAAPQNNRLNYLGVGGTIGLKDNGETALGEGGFSLLGRYSFTDNFSIHSSAIFNDEDLLSIAATVGIPIENQETGRTIIFPFIGAGISADTEYFNVNPEITTGVDLPINSLITGTIRVNANFDDETDIGLLLGAGVNF